MGGGDLNLKKSFHPGLGKNRAAVYDAEQQALAERKRTQDRVNEIKEERAQEELQKKLEAAGGRKRIDKVDWMYAGPTDGQSGTTEEKEAYLLGKRRIDNLITGTDHQKLEKNAGEQSFMAAQNANTSRDLASKIRNDPLLAMKQKEQAAYDAYMKNASKQRPSQIKDEKRKDRARRGEERYSRRRYRHRSDDSDEDRERRKRRRSHSRSRSPRRRRDDSGDRSQSHMKREYSRDRQSRRRRDDDEDRPRRRSPRPERRSSHRDYDRDTEDRPRRRSPRPDRRNEQRDQDRDSRPRRQEQSDRNDRGPRNGNGNGLRNGHGNDRNVKQEQPSPDHSLEDDRARRLAAMTSAATDMEDERKDRLAAGDERERIKREEDDEGRERGGDRGFTNALHKKAGDISLGDRMGRMRQTVKVERDDD